jgi:hypothetical protein
MNFSQFSHQIEEIGYGFYRVFPCFSLKIHGGFWSKLITRGTVFASTSSWWMHDSYDRWNFRRCRSGCCFMGDFSGDSHDFLGGLTCFNHQMNQTSFFCTCFWPCFLGIQVHFFWGLPSNSMCLGQNSWMVTRKLIWGDVPDFMVVWSESISLTLRNDSSPTDMFFFCPDRLQNISTHWTQTRCLDKHDNTLCHNAACLWMPMDAYGDWSRSEHPGTRGLIHSCSPYDFLFNEECHCHHIINQSVATGRLHLGSGDSGDSFWMSGLLASLASMASMASMGSLCRTYRHSVNLWALVS